VCVCVCVFITLHGRCCLPAVDSCQRLFAAVAPADFGLSAHEQLAPRRRPAVEAAADVAEEDEDENAMLQSLLTGAFPAVVHAPGKWCGAPSSSISSSSSSSSSSLAASASALAPAMTTKARAGSRLAMGPCGLTALRIAFDPPLTDCAGPEAAAAAALAAEAVEAAKPRAVRHAKRPGEGRERGILV